MRGLLVARRRIGVAIDLEQRESRRIVVLLDDVEADDARFLDAVARVLERRRLEGVDSGLT